MELNWQVCSRARLARDPRFDGKFFIAVLSTGIYCRSVCRARTSKESNVRYFPTAAAAAEAGFRPCLRCRPECAPGTAAALGTRNTVSRALRLIEESALEDGGIESLAQRLGIGARHLRRLFLRHLGATPSAVAQTRRLHFAKKLIDETRLSMTEVAIASGFGCVRRFNATIQKTYRRTPTEIRKLAMAVKEGREHEYALRLNFRPPYHWTALLEYLAARATPGVELVANQKYRRAISLDGQVGSIEVGAGARTDELVLAVQFPDPRRLFTIVERVRAIFDLNADWAVIAATLRRDSMLKPLVEGNPGLRVPGCWDGFELTVRAILGQQVSVAAATTMAGRVANFFGQPVSLPEGISRVFPTPEALANADLTRVGLTSARSNTIRMLARAVVDGRVNFALTADPGALIEKLLEIRGIGQWTAQYVAMRALRDPDAFPSADLGIMRALEAVSPGEAEQRSQAWRPWRAYAAMYLWGMNLKPYRQARKQAPAAASAWNMDRDGSSSALQEPS